MAKRQILAIQLQIVLRRGATLVLSTAILVGFCGCSSEAPLESPAQSTDSPAHSTGDQAIVPTVHRQPGPTAGPLLAAPIAEGEGGAEKTPPAKRLFIEMLRRYREAESYSDNGTVRLSYHERGVAQTDTAPLAVRYHSSGRLSLRAYSLQLVCDNSQLLAQVDDEPSQNLGNQRLQQALPPGRLSLETIYADPTLVQFATAGLGGPAPQLELLFGETPLSGLLAGDSQYLLEPPGQIDQHACHRVAITSEPLRYVLWIDQRTLVLRRIELPQTLIAGLVDDVTIRDARLSIELNDATFAPQPRADFSLDARVDPIAVARFVPPPPPLVSPLLGRTPPPFLFDAYDSQDRAAFRITESGADREVTVLLWVARHEGSQAAAVGLEQLIQAMPPEAQKSVRCVVVMAELNNREPTAQLLRAWQVNLPWTDDSKAVGRDIFGVEEAPTLCVLSSRGQVEWFQHRVEPGALQALPQVITDLLAGAAVGQTLREEHSANREAYQAALRDAASGH